MSVPEHEEWPPLRAEVAVMRWGGFWRRGRWWLTMLLSLVLVTAGVACMVWLRRTPPALVGDVLFMPCVLIAVGCWTFAALARAWRGYWVSVYDKVCKDTPPDAPQLAFYQAQRMQLKGMSFLRAKNRLAWVAMARSTGVTTWVDGRVAGDVLHLPRVNRPVEPERVGTFWQQSESRFGAVSAMMGGMQLVGHNTIPGVIWLSVAGLMVVKLALRGALFEPVVAGQGWVQHGRSRWTVDDSVATIRQRTRNNVNIRLIGPAGVLQLRVSRRTARKDDSMRDFWLRWCHPTPRLDQAAFDA